MLTTGDVAKMVQVSTRTIDNYLAKGLIPRPARAGRAYVWTPEDVQRLREVLKARGEHKPSTQRFVINHGRNNNSFGNDKPTDYFSDEHRRRFSYPLPWLRRTGPGVFDWSQHKEWAEFCARCAGRAEKQQ